MHPKGQGPLAWSHEHLEGCCGWVISVTNAVVGGGGGVSPCPHHLHTQIPHVEPTMWGHICQKRYIRRDSLEIVDSEGHACLTRNRQKVQHRIR